MGWFQLKSAKNPSRKNREFFEDVSAFLSHFYKIAGKTKIVYCILAVFMLGMSLIGILQGLSWDHKVRTFVPVKGTILKNNIRRARRSRGGSKSVSDLQYSYTYKGRTYLGHKIAYGEDMYPRQYQKGAVRPILVNPARPKESFAMVYYRSGALFFIRYTHVGIFLITGVGFLIAFIRSLRPRKSTVPDVLRAYLAQFSQEEILQAQSEAQKLGSISGRSPLSLVTFSRKVRSRCMERYQLVGGSVSPWGASIIFAFLCIGLILLCTTQNGVFLLHILLISVVFFFILFPSKLVLDLHEKRIFSYRIFFPEEPSAKKCVSFEEIEFLYLVRNDAGKNQSIAYCCARMKDGDERTLLQITAPDLPYFLEFLPELAKSLGNKKILFLKF